jgi:hypothetical protein
VVQREHKQHRAHRYFYEQHRGPIPDGLVIDHLCRVPACVNPEHLEATNQFENVRRGRLPKLTEEAIREIRAATPYRGYLAALARKYNVTHDTPRKVREGTRWKQLV